MKRSVSGPGCVEQHAIVKGLPRRSSRRSDVSDRAPAAVPGREPRQDRGAPEIRLQLAFQIEAGFPSPTLEKFRLADLLEDGNGPRRTSADCR